MKINWGVDRAATGTLSEWGIIELKPEMRSWPYKVHQKSISGRERSSLLQRA